MSLIRTAWHVIAPLAAANFQIGLITFINNVVVGVANLARSVIIGLQNVISGGNHDTGGLLGLIVKVTDKAASVYKETGDDKH